MKIPAILYFCCWALSSCTFVRLGFMALDKERLPNIPPLVIHIFKLNLCASVIYSAACALLERSRAICLPVQQRVRLLMNPNRFGVLCPTWIYTLPMSLHSMKLNRDFIAVYSLACAEMLSPSGSDLVDSMMPHTATLYICTRLPYWSSLYNCWQAWPNRERYSSISNVLKFLYKVKETPKFAVAMFLSIVFQNYVKFSAFSHVLAFLCFAGAWLGCTAMRMSSQDYGVFYFLLSNAIIGCTVNTFELRSQTWFAYAAAVLLFGLRRGFEVVRLVPEEDVVCISNDSKCFSRKVSNHILLILCWLYFVRGSIYLILLDLEAWRFRSKAVQILSTILYFLIIVLLAVIFVQILQKFLK